MSHERIAVLLDDYVEGGLSAETRREVEEHLARCEECRADVAGLRSLLNAAEALPRRVEPPRDLWPAIDARLGRRSAWRSTGRRRYALAAAAVLLIALSSTLTIFVVEKRADKPRPDPVTSMPVGAAVLSAHWRILEREYEAAAAELRETMAALEGDLSPRTRRIVEENLAVIDGAIDEARAALARDPANRELAELLGSVYRQKLDVLRQATRL